MSNNINKELQAYFNGQILESPSDDFTENIMSSLVNEKKALIIKPLITRNSWLIISSLFLLFVVSISILVNPVEIAVELPKLNINWKFMESGSKKVSIALLTFCILLMLQFTLITKRFKRISY